MEDREIIYNKPTKEGSRLYLKEVRGIVKSKTENGLYFVFRTINGIDGEFDLVEDSSIVKVSEK
jgi:hypothetical protein